MTFSFFLFSSSIPTENLQKIFHIFAENILWKKTFMNPLGPKENFIGWTKQAISLHLAPLGSQSHLGIWFILPAQEASHVIKSIPTCIHQILKCFLNLACLYLHWLKCNAFLQLFVWKQRLWTSMQIFHQKHLRTFIINESMICLQTYISNTCPLSTLSSTSANALTWRGEWGNAACTHGRPKIDRKAFTNPTTSKSQW